MASLDHNDELMATGNATLDTWHSVYDNDRHACGTYPYLNKELYTVYYDINLLVSYTAIPNEVSLYWVMLGYSIQRGRVVTCQIF